MVVSLGLPITKDTGNIDVVQLVPNSPHYWSDDTFIDLAAVGGNLTTRHERNVITYTRASKTNRQRANMCRNTKTLRFYGGQATERSRTNYDSGSTHQYYLVAQHHITAEAAHASAIALARTNFGVTLEDGVLGAAGQGFINQAVTELRPDLTVAQVPNFLLDVEDIRRLYQIWHKNTSVAKNLAGLRLNWKFGVKPLIGDLQAIVEAISSTREKIAAFEKSLNQLFHRSKVMLEDSQTLTGTNLFTSETNTTWSAELHRQVTAHIVYRPMKLPQIGALYKVLGGLLDSLGFELNPRIVWDAIPFSFVLDWFFDVGSFLGQYKLDTLELPIAYVDSYLQYKQTLKFESSTQITYGRTEFKPWIRSGGWTTEETYFQRMPILPDFATISGLGWKIPTTSQWINLVALATVLKK
jgi:hypothetical protein